MSEFWDGFACGIVSIIGLNIVVLIIVMWRHMFGDPTGTPK